jgi:hypothetical protein
MEYVKCENCQCWDTESFIKLFAGLPGINGKTGFCRRHAPRPTTAIYAISCIAKMFLFKTTYSAYVQNLMVQPQTMHDVGCWEGIKKDG